MSTPTKAAANTTNVQASASPPGKVSSERIKDWAIWLADNKDKLPPDYSLEEVYVLWYMNNLKAARAVIVPGFEGIALFKISKVIEDAPVFNSELDVDTVLLKLTERKDITYNPIPPGVTIH